MPKMILTVLIMALVTYVIRMLPMAFMRRKIKSQFLQSFFFYIPYTVLASMTFPYVVYSTGNIYAGIIGTVVAIIASLTKRSLIIVAMLSALAVLIFNYAIILF